MVRTRAEGWLGQPRVALRWRRRQWSLEADLWRRKQRRLGLRGGGEVAAGSDNGDFRRDGSSMEAGQTAARMRARVEQSRGEPDGAAGDSEPAERSATQSRTCSTLAARDSGGSWRWPLAAEASQRGGGGPTRPQW